MRALIARVERILFIQMFLLARVGIGPAVDPEWQAISAALLVEMGGFGRLGITIGPSPMYPAYMDRS
jgi:hypothetical protein